MMMRSIFLLAATLAFAKEPPPETFMGAEVPSRCSYLAPHRNCILSNEKLHQTNFYTALDFLYWQGGMDGLEYAFQNTGSQFDQTGSVEKLHFPWEPAVRLLVGYHLPYDKWWNLDFAFTYFNSTRQDHSQLVFDRINNPGPGLISVWTAPFAFGDRMIGARWTDASARWHFTADIFDLMLRHNLCVGSALSIEPAFGLKFALLRQHYKVDYTLGNQVFFSTGIPQNLISSSISMKGHSLNLGPEFSLASRWQLATHWSLFSTLSASLLGTRFTMGRDESDYAQNGSGAVFSDFIRISQPAFWTLRPQAALQFGLSWANCYSRPNFVLHYSFSLSYEAQYWWKQNMLLRYVDGGNQSLLTEVAPTQGDLFLQGLTADIGFDF